MPARHFWPHWRPRTDRGRPGAGRSSCTCCGLVCTACTNKQPNRQPTTVCAASAAPPLPRQAALVRRGPGGGRQVKSPEKRQDQNGR